MDGSLRVSPEKSNILVAKPSHLGVLKSREDIRFPDEFVGQVSCIKGRRYSIHGIIRALQGKFWNFPAI